MYTRPLTWTQPHKFISYDNVWYIKSGASPVVFEDIYGTELTRCVERGLRPRLLYLSHHNLRTGDFSNGDSIRREPIVLDQYGGYVIPPTHCWDLDLLPFQSPLPFDFMDEYSHRSSKRRSHRSSYRRSDGWVPRTSLKQFVWTNFPIEGTQCYENLPTRTR